LEPLSLRLRLTNSIVIRSGPEPQKARRQLLRSVVLANLNC
jgi:hypothetical protein